VEAEAYRGPEDRASHAYGGRRTTRTEAMYGAPGLAYVFFVYGMHWHFNLVTTAKDVPHAVLIRALEPVSGQELMAKRRGVPESSPLIANGPGKLCQAFAIDRRHYGADLTKRPLFLAEGEAGSIVCSPRIGVGYAGAWARKPWRFYERDNRWVSPVRATPVRAVRSL
jgi:DNA-3-methyladenine glycosylase